MSEKEVNVNWGAPPNGVTFVPNKDARNTNEELLKFRAERAFQDPETVVVVPFSELEGSLTVVNTNLRVDGQPVAIDVAGDFAPSAFVEDEEPSVLGEKLADELDSFEPLHPTDIANQTTAFIVGQTYPPPTTVVTSDEDITKLEQQAVGETDASLRFSASGENGK